MSIGKLNGIIQDVSIHAPAGGATGEGEAISDWTNSFQSTLPRGERPLSNGATPNLSWSFNPRSRGGSDSYLNSKAGLSFLFQSTLPRGERPTIYDIVVYKSSVSIHAPAGGATYLSSNPKTDPFSFQSTLPRGERHFGLSPPPILRLFQSTLPRGERLRSSISAPIGKKFQSTLPRGERHQRR